MRVCCIASFYFNQFSGVSFPFPSFINCMFLKKYLMCIIWENTSDAVNNELADFYGCNILYQFLILYTLFSALFHVLRILSSRTRISDL